MKDRLDVASEYWASLLRHSRLGLLTDVDGTLLPFRARPDDVTTSPELVALIQEIASTEGVSLAVVSGRPREDLERLFPERGNVLLVAEHGAWRTGPAGWEATLSLDSRIIDSLVFELESLGAQYEKARIERKTWSAASHYRRLPPEEKSDLLARVGAVLDPWLAKHPNFERLWGAEVLEIRPRGATKATAVSWMRDRLGPSARLLIAGDDITDEDMFVAASEGDATVLVRSGPVRSSAARWRISSVDEMQALLEDLLVVRRDSTIAPSVRPSRMGDETRPEPKTTSRLLVVSNRLPELAPGEATRAKNVGGLVSALVPVLQSQEGVWLGWSGAAGTAGDPVVSSVGDMTIGAIDLPEDWYRHYYIGFANTALWPLLHSFPARVRISHDDFRSYVLANDAFAAASSLLVPESAAVWVHDYHLLLLAQLLRARGHVGRIGHFLHVPFPGPDVFFLLPWANEILDAMLEFDLVGFHTRAYAENFLHCVAHRSGVVVDGYRAIRHGRVTHVGVFPLGVSPTDLDASDDLADNEVLGIKRSLGECQLVLGVDRLDYTKGIPERIEAFGRLLEIHPEWRRRVCFVQVSVPSRAEIDEYAEQRSRIENSVGRINGTFGEADWVPIRYLYRSYGRSELNELYRTADVGYVTPLRDGMNLVAKEFVAAQDPMEPGVLLLSRFAGAAEELTDALLTNPWDIEGVVHDLDRALRMPLAERKVRHTALLEVVSRRTALNWAQDFVRALTEDVGEEPWSAEVAVHGERRSGLWVAPAGKAYTAD